MTKVTKLVMWSAIAFGAYWMFVRKPSIAPSKPFSEGQGDNGLGNANTPKTTDTGYTAGGTSNPTGSGDGMSSGAAQP